MEETQSNSLLSTLSGNTLVTETGVIDRVKVPIYDHGIIALFEKEIGTGGICAGLFLERAHEPVALYFVVGLSVFAGSEPGWLSQN